MQGSRGTGAVGGAGTGMGAGKGAGRGRMGGQSMGPGGFCVCPSCGTRLKHKQGAPCYEMKCPKCG
ncbi:MAG: dinitrogenase iron-molybdenum cofactor biosynthesis protein, partial [Actinomycetia bacterium]|nr:dinitrogenase iron-molybdenum cofactor biosynthesis protein [Actinomycetes bacterium]